VGLASIAIVAQSIAWLWWCERPPRSKRSLSYATLAWMMFGVCGSMPILVLSVSGDAVPGTLTLGEFADVTWSLGVTSSYLGISYAMAAAFAASAAIGYAGRAAYWIAGRLTNRPSDSLRHDRPDYFPHFVRPVRTNRQSWAEDGSPRLRG